MSARDAMTRIAEEIRASQQATGQALAITHGEIESLSYRVSQLERLFERVAEIIEQEGAP